MGGYAAYVWAAYGVTLLGLGGAVATALRSYLRAKSLLAEVERRTWR
jgi:heme exporter protein CcmD